ncbi:hypothetical protein [Wenxinia marina]|uniref:GlsB/YeaQ/YmgE family stress response membrane protein n=1 Tax=Wenxinia marina DSM 24838 TaxID=1123501 RepID=A0A0D0PYI0_9RHOB|nr:hypothetical protein [Wenxinia marina]KIQ67489.1 hypothetical protein Wenmar_03913 [Wenxinia marina DSM 24838]GGL69131.1 hypothetical protein GCM10011392_24460 [Wenxinia marina]
MEAFFEALGWVAFVLLVLIGLAAGWIAGMLAGRNRLAYLALGVIGAIAAPLILFALGVTALAAGGVILILIVAAVGAALLLALGRAVFGRR